MWFKNIFYAVIIFSVVFMCFMLVQADFSQKYSVPVEDNDTALYDKINETMSIVNESAGIMYRAEHEDTSTFYLMTKQTVQSIRLFFKMPEIIMSIVSLIASSKYIGIPGWIVGAFLTILLITVTLYVISVFAKRGWGD